MEVETVGYMVLIIIFKSNFVDSTNLNDKRPVFRAGLKTGLFVARVVDEDGGVQHRRVAELCSVPARQQPPGELTGIHHRRHHVPRAAQPLPHTLAVRHPVDTRHASKYKYRSCASGLPDK